MNKSFIIGAICCVVSVLAPAYGAGDPAAGKTKSATCAACHGADGNAMIPDYPNLAGQGEAYLVKQLMEFKSGERNNPIMAPMAAPLSEEDMEDLAAYYASLAPKAGVASEENLNLGQDIFRGGITAAKIPACTGCHGPNGVGNPAALYPALSGQNAAYIASALKEFRSGARANDPNSMMRSLALRLTDAEIDAVSNYIQGLH
ncbi:MAG TPA: cytochrome c4 [Gammaproteobacteria bacterium]|jgi:cytochrome c553|nr:cytochrome c4 [Gammaproteobacteria bacterium]